MPRTADYILNIPAEAEFDQLTHLAASVCTLDLRSMDQTKPAAIQCLAA